MGRKLNEPQSAALVEADVRTLANALEAAFRWLYQDTGEYVRGKKPDPKFDGSFLNDLADMRAGLRVLKARESLLTTENAK